MMNRLFKRGMLIALAAAMTTSAGVPAMAAQKETQEETVTTSEVTQTNVDYGSLTQKEIEEFNSIYDRLDAIDKEVMKDADGLSDEDIYARYDQYQDETDTLMDRLEELDKKPGGSTTRNMNIPRMSIMLCTIQASSPQRKQNSFRKHMKESKKLMRKCGRTMIFQTMRSKPAMQSMMTRLHH